VEADVGILTIVVQLIFLEGILSIDNAAVLGAMVLHLPDDAPIPWPGPLRGLSQHGLRWLGSQRQAALRVGLLGAYAGRALMLLLAGVIITVPWLRILGAAYLLYLALHYFTSLGERDAEEAAGIAPPVRYGSGFWMTVGATILADLAFSLDNVIAAVALSDTLWIVLLGVGIGMVIMRFAASLFSRLIAWEPALESAAYLLLLAIAGELLAEELFGLHISEGVQFAISLAIIGLTIIVARTPLRQPVHLVARPLLLVLGRLGASIGQVRRAVIQLLPLKSAEAHRALPGDEP
jgi:tellurite resistance protein TerC